MSQSAQKSLIKFKRDILQDAEYIEGFTAPRDIYGGRETVYRDHPKLVKLLDKANKHSIKGRLKIIKPYLDNFYAKNAAPYRSGFRRIESEWKKVESSVVKALCDIMNRPAASAPKATCYVGSISIYPRDIESRTFQICFKQPVFDALTTILHEYTHFLYFQTWKKLFPQDVPDAYAGPNIFWQLSEILAVVINNDERILEIIPDATDQGFQFNNKDYSCIQTPGTPFSIMGFFRNLYLKCKRENVPFNEFLKKSRTEITKLDKQLKLVPIIKT